VRPTITATPKRKSATIPRSPTRKASGKSEIVSGRSSPAVSMRSPTMSARAVSRVGAVVTGSVSVMASFYDAACAIASRRGPGGLRSLFERPVWR